MMKIYHIQPGHGPGRYGPHRPGPFMCRQPRLLQPSFGPSRGRCQPQGRHQPADLEKELIMAAMLASMQDHQNKPKENQTPRMHSRPRPPCGPSHHGRRLPPIALAKRRMLRFKMAAMQKEQKENTNFIESFQKFHRQETENETKLTIDVAGFVANDLQIHFKNGILSLRGKRQNKLGDTFSLERMVELNGSHDKDDIRAFIEEGVLEITLQKKTKKPATVAIPIQTAVEVEKVKEEEAQKLDTMVHTNSQETPAEHPVPTAPNEEPLQVETVKEDVEEPLQVETVKEEAVSENEEEDISSWEDVEHHRD